MLTHICHHMVSLGHNELTQQKCYLLIIHIHNHANSNVKANDGQTHWYIYIFHLALSKLLVTFLIHYDCINSLWPSDAMWWNRTGSTLAQLISTHHQGDLVAFTCWQLHTKYSRYLSILDMNLEITDLRLHSSLSKGHWVNHILQLECCCCLLFLSILEPSIILPQWQWLIGIIN